MTGWLIAGIIVALIGLTVWAIVSGRRWGREEEKRRQLDAAVKRAREAQEERDNVAKLPDAELDSELARRVRGSGRA